MRHFFHRVSVPRRNPYFDWATAFHNRLTAKTRIDLETRRFLNAVFLFLFGFGTIGHPFGHVNVACRACTHTAAGMFNVDTSLNGYLQQRLTLCGLQLPDSLIGIR